MKFSIQVVIEGDNGSSIKKNIVDLERKDFAIETLGLKLQESKQITAELQKTMIEQQLQKYLEEQHVYANGCQNDVDNLPRPDDPLMVGIDGGYVHARKGKNRKAGWFEVIVGKSLQEGKENKRFGFVVNYDKKPKRRLYEMLKGQGFQMNQQITFLSDGGDTVRDLQLYLSPRSEHILDWFHVTMRLTVMKQMAKNISLEDEDLKITEKLDRIKWCLWHGNVFKALQKIELLCFDLEIFYEKPKSREWKLHKMLEEFETYIKSNSSFIPNYAERYRYGEYISSGFVESTVNELISRRMVKKQQMRWTQMGAHLLLQVRIKTLNNELKKCFCKWYPKMEQEKETILQTA